MPHFINPVEEDQCVFLTYEGDLAPLEISAARYKAGGLLEAKQWNRIVVDLTALRSPPMAVELLERVKGCAVDSSQRSRIAIIVRPEQYRNARLLTTVARNHGALLNFFSTYWQP
jgi:hypothetical protein